MSTSTTREVFGSVIWGFLLLVNLSFLLAFGSFFISSDWKPEVTHNGVPSAQEALRQFKQVEDTPLEKFGKKGEYREVLKVAKEDAFRNAVAKCDRCYIWFDQNSPWKAEMELKARANPATISQYYAWFIFKKISQFLMMSISGFLLFVLWKTRRKSLFPYLAALSFGIPVLSFLIPIATFWFDDMFLASVPVLNDRTFGFFIFGIVMPFLAWPPVMVIARKRMEAKTSLAA